MPKPSGDSSDKSRTALLLSPEAPYPMMGGGPLRTASILEYLAQHYTVDVIVFREPGTPDPRTAFPPGLVRNVGIIDLPYHSKGLPAKAARNAKRLLRGAPPLVDRFSGFDLTEALADRQYSIAGGGAFLDRRLLRSPENVL
jgi:hypothetical protein